MIEGQEKDFIRNGPQAQYTVFDGIFTEELFKKVHERCDEKA